MTASKKKTVRTRRGVEPAGRPARHEVELGKESTNELVQDVRAERRIPKRGASEASKDGEKGASHAQNGVAETGRGRTHATSREPAWSELELPGCERYAECVATA